MRDARTPPRTLRRKKRAGGPRVANRPTPEAAPKTAQQLRELYSAWKLRTRAGGEWSALSIGTMGDEEIAGMLILTLGSAAAALRACSHMPAPAQSRFSPVRTLLERATE